MSAAANPQYLNMERTEGGRQGGRMEGREEGRKEGRKGERS